MKLNRFANVEFVKCAVGNEDSTTDFVVMGGMGHVARQTDGCTQSHEHTDPAEFCWIAGLYLLARRASVERIIRTQGIQTLQCGHPGAGLVGLAVKQRYGLPYVVLAYALETTAPLSYSLNWKKSQYARLFQNADAVITISSYTDHAVHNWGGIQVEDFPDPIGRGHTSSPSRPIGSCRAPATWFG